MQGTFNFFHPFQKTQPLPGKSEEVQEVVQLAYSAQWLFNSDSLLFRCHKTVNVFHLVLHTITLHDMHLLSLN